VYGPSAKAYNDKYPHPKEMSEKDMQYVEDAFVAATKRCKAAGFDFIEMCEAVILVAALVWLTRARSHAAHGYLFHSFLSPISNMRTDAYGGALERRMAYPLRVTAAVRAAWGERPLFVRISATDFHEGPEKDEQGAWRQWGVEQSIAFCGELTKLGVDFVDISAGGNDPEQQIAVKPGYQVCSLDSTRGDDTLTRAHYRSRTRRRSRRRTRTSPSAQSG
jgi:2,4-dienoyl-CoA reductase-like NADH-dependent reductase (Old Yellow Enzyme family)